jgi:hypothetical protein
MNISTGVLTGDVERMRKARCSRCQGRILDASPQLGQFYMADGDPSQTYCVNCVTPTEKSNTEAEKAWRRSR